MAANDPNVSQLAQLLERASISEPIQGQAQAQAWARGQVDFLIHQAQAQAQAQRQAQQAQLLSYLQASLEAQRHTQALAEQQPYNQALADRVAQEEAMVQAFLLKEAWRLGLSPDQARTMDLGRVVALMEARIRASREQEEIFFERFPGAIWLMIALH